jgi:hypothetical protein
MTHGKHAVKRMRHFETLRFKRSQRFPAVFGAYNFFCGTPGEPLRKDCPRKSTQALENFAEMCYNYK